MSTPTSTGYRDYIQVMSSRLNRAEEARRAARAAQAASSEIRQAESTAASGPNRYIVDLQGNRYGRPSSATPWSDSATPQIPSSLSSGAVSRSQPSSSPHKPSNANQHRFPIPAYLKASNAYNRMVTQQVQSDFSKISPVLLPTQWDEKKCCEVLEMSGDGLTVQFRGTGKNGAKDAAAVKADRHMPHQCGVYYFEIEILSKGQSGYIGIGFSGPEVSLTRLPGWEDNSYGYHGDDGNSFCSQGTGGPFGPTFTTEDIVGCGIDWSTRRAFFTKNGILIDFCFSDLKGELFPSVGLRTPGEVVKANFGQAPFAFDIVDFANSRKTAFHKSIASTDIPSHYLDDNDEARVENDAQINLDSPTKPKHQDLRSTMAQLVSNYLVYHGYIDTLAAFKAEETTSRQAIEGIDISSRSAMPDRPQPGPKGTELPKVPPEALESIQARRNLCQLVVQGNSRQALSELRVRFPEVLDKDKATNADVDESIVFQLRVQEFLDVINSNNTASLDGDQEMEIDQDAPVPSLKARQKRKAEPQEEQEEETHLDRALALGQAIYKDYRHYANPKVQAMLKRMFSLFAYTHMDQVQDDDLRQMTHDGLKETRIHLARLLNARILGALGRQSESALESIYRQTSLLLTHIEDKLQGKAAFATIFNHNALEGD